MKTQFKIKIEICFYFKMILILKNMRVFLDTHSNSRHTFKYFRHTFAEKAYLPLATKPFRQYEVKKPYLNFIGYHNQQK